MLSVIVVKNTKNSSSDCSVCRNLCGMQRCSSEGSHYYNPCKAPWPELVENLTKALNCVSKLPETLSISFPTEFFGRFVPEQKAENSSNLVKCIFSPEKFTRIVSWKDVFLQKKCILKEQ